MGICPSPSNFSYCQKGAPGASHSSRAAWGSIPDPQLDKAVGQGAALSCSVLFLAELPLVEGAA